jgi:hypothetical protein
LHDSSSLVGLLFAGLGNKEVVVCLLQVELSSSEVGISLVAFGREVGNYVVGVTQGGVGLVVCILGGGEFSLGIIVDLGGQVKGVSSSINNIVGLLKLILGSAKSLLGSTVGVECQIVDILGIQSSSNGSLGVLGSLRALGLSIDEDVVGLLEVLICFIESILSIS